jgi:dsDNA-binding SOS-regulon protein
MQHAYKHAKAKLGVDVDPEEIDKKVASGPKKPSKGKTNSYRLLDKGGKKAIQVQVYGMDNGKYELNMYKESVDINEAHDPKHVKMAIGVASDKRYKQGNYSGAVRAIEKIKKGLSKNPQVAAVLKKQNEDNNISNRSAALKPQIYNDPVTGKKKVRMVPSKSNIVKTNDPEDVKEAHDPKHVKMAIGVASDKRYKQGNYTGAVRAIEKIKKGLSKHPQVAAVLKRQNEAKDPGEYDQEGDMAKTQLKTIMRNASDHGGKMDEEMDPTKHVSKKGDMYCVYNKDGKEVAKFDNKKDADAYAIKNHDKLMEYLEVGTDAIRKSYAAMTPGQNEALAATDRAFAIGAVGAAAYAAKKAKDRFDPVKVRDARKKRAEKRAERSDAERELAQNRRDRQNYQKKLRQMRDRQNKQRNKR